MVMTVHQYMYYDFETTLLRSKIPYRNKKYKTAEGVQVTHSSRMSKKERQMIKTNILIWLNECSKNVNLITKIPVEQQIVLIE